MSRTAALVARCQQICSEDDEWLDTDELRPFVIVPSADEEDNAPVLYATKLNDILRAHGEFISRNLMLCGRYGLVTPASEKLIRCITSGRRLLFLGDLDPLDLTVYAQLCELSKNASHPAEYVGIDDAWICAAERRGVGLDKLTIQLSAFECAVRDELLHALMYPANLGPRCRELLMTNRKVEIDAFLSRFKRDRSFLADVLHHEFLR